MSEEAKEATVEEPEEEEKAGDKSKAEAVDHSQVKLVVKLKRGTDDVVTGSVGVQSPGCDPVLFPITGNLTLSTFLGPLQVFVEKARKVWEGSPKYKKTDFKAPEKPKSKPASTYRPPVKAKEEKPKVMQNRLI